MMERDDSVSVAKGIGIILMVLGHSGFYSFGTTIIYMFHMPLFFFISGYCFNEKHLSNFEGYAKKRIKKLYIPYVAYSLCFLLLHNLFFELNIYNDTWGYNGEVSWLYTTRELLNRAIRIVVALDGDEMLLGGYWFLHTLFFSSFMFWGILKLINEHLWWVALILFGCLFLLFKGHVPFLNIGKTEVFATFFIFCGYYYKSLSLHLFVNKNKRLILPLCASFLVLGAIYWPSRMDFLHYKTILTYSLSAISGSIITMAISVYLVSAKNISSKILAFIGNNTLQILTWHLLCFKIISFVIIKAYHLQSEHLAEFPVIGNYAAKGWWVCYLIIGVTVPLLGTLVLNKLKSLPFTKKY